VGGLVHASYQVVSGRDRNFLVCFHPYMHMLTLIVSCHLLHRLRRRPFCDVPEEPYTLGTICRTTQHVVYGCYFIS
jgi:hypothetical protein